jgi:2-oxo-4-hydroxy-4-carboxy-5-ureidoimidazoline decarboxylase
VTLGDLNALDAESAARELRRCCGSTAWARAMTGARPFPNVEALLAAGDRIWSSLTPADWLEAFAAHPRIGDDGSVGSRRSDGSSESGGSSESAAWSAGEQSGVDRASDATRRRLADANRDYEARFGYIFIVCATGKSGREMLDLLGCRMHSEPDVELGIAAGEQRKILRLRLVKLIEAQQVTTT